jgi:hypothetical protein
MRVLDVGAGTGRYTEAVLRMIVAEGGPASPGDSSPPLEATRSFDDHGCVGERRSGSLMRLNPPCFAESGSPADPIVLAGDPRE